MTHLIVGPELRAWLIAVVTLAALSDLLQLIEVGISLSKKFKRLVERAVHIPEDDRE